MSELFISALQIINDFIWGSVTLVILALSGLYLTVGLKFLQFRKLGYSFSELFKKHHHDKSLGEISPFASLMTALSATVGTSNIVGVAIAIFIGGAGAIFYMWVFAIIGMSIKYCECLLGVEYRTRNAEGKELGGPMYYMAKGIGGKFGTLLGGFTAILLIGVAIGFGNSVQANTIAYSIAGIFHIPPYISGIILAGLVSFVILGGIARIAATASRIMPVMIVIYVLCGLAVIISHINRLDDVLIAIFSHAFDFNAVAGGISGATIAYAIQFGANLGMFSNDIGTGNSAIAHASAQTKNPVRQAHIGMLGTFIDTIIICTITALVILITDADHSGRNDIAMVFLGFSSLFGVASQYLFSIIWLVFVFTTIIVWSFYGERALHYLNLASKRNILIYRIGWVAMIVLSSFVNFNLIWSISSIFLGLLIYPNMITVLWLSPKIFNKTKEFWQE